MAKAVDERIRFLKERIGRIEREFELASRAEERAKAEEAQENAEPAFNLRKEPRLFTPRKMREANEQ